MAHRTEGVGSAFFFFCYARANPCERFCLYGFLEIDHLRNEVMQHIRTPQPFLDQTLSVNIQVDWSAGPLNKWALRCKHAWWVHWLTFLIASWFWRFFRNHLFWHVCNCSTLRLVDCCYLLCCFLKSSQIFSLVEAILSGNMPCRTWQTTYSGKTERSQVCAQQHGVTQPN